MTALSVGTLQGLNKCYDYEKKELELVEFNKVLSFWHQNQFYSDHIQASI
jgi:hypothetical protein